MQKKTGTANALIAPTKPKLPDPADEANPGEMDEVKKREREVQKGKYGSTKVAPFKPRKAPDQNKELTWIGVQLTRTDGTPAAGELYEVILDDGTCLASGSLDENGEAKVEGINPQTATIKFPNLHKDVWKPR